ncbi:MULTISPECIES: hypothetical protein [Parafrankia]|uniref:hypothetical protein n=1 Tax=Parafrankia TaxID=2994362 RepID=UPI001D02AFAC|nr:MULTISPECIES: hypothetical protein [Parafrankia]
MTVREFVSGLAFIARDVWRPTPRSDLYLDCDVCGGATPHSSYRRIISATKENPTLVAAPPEPVCAVCRDAHPRRRTALRHGHRLYRAAVASLALGQIPAAVPRAVHRARVRADCDLPVVQHPAGRSSQASMTPWRRLAHTSHRQLLCRCF